MTIDGEIYKNCYPNAGTFHCLKNNGMMIDGSDVIKIKKSTQEDLNPKPEPLPKNKMNMNSIIESAKDYIDFVWSSEYNDDGDDEHYIFENVTTAIYGKDIWNKANKEINRKYK